ncbi:MAG: hypothetical protein P8127_09465, partial [Acidobacteriota bacterium]
RPPRPGANGFAEPRNGIARSMAGEAAGSTAKTPRHQDIMKPAHTRDLRFRLQRAGSASPQCGYAVIDGFVSLW